MKYFCVVIVVICLADSSYSIQNGNSTTGEPIKELGIGNQANITNNANISSIPHPEINATKNGSYPENTTETYVPDFIKEIFSGNRREPENNTRTPETIVYDTRYKGFDLSEVAGITAVCFLSLAVLGYIGFVSLRRYLQNKYGNSQTLITEDEYDTSDLKNFEI